MKCKNWTNSTNLERKTKIFKGGGWNLETGSKHFKGDMNMNQLTIPTYSGNPVDQSGGTVQSDESKIGLFARIRFRFQTRKKFSDLQKNLKEINHTILHVQKIISIII